MRLSKHVDAKFTHTEAVASSVFGISASITFIIHTVAGLKSLGIVLILVTFLVWSFLDLTLLALRPVLRTILRISLAALVFTSTVSPLAYGSRILVDSTNGPGIILANLFNIQLDQVQVYGCLGPGIGMNNVSKSTFSKVKCYGAKGTTNAPANAAGITLQNCSSVTLDVAEVDNFTGSGVVMVASTECQVNGGYSNNNTGYGYYDDSAGDRNRRLGVTARGNTGGSLFQDKASHATYSWTPNSGTPTASTIGATTVP